LKLPHLSSTFFKTEEKKEEKEKPNDQEFNILEEKIKTASAPSPGTLPSSIQKEFQETLSNAKQIHLKDSDLLPDIPSSRSKIDLNEAKIDEIKVAVSKISLSPPSWAKKY
jgi:hypothetical protein